LAEPVLDRRVPVEEYLASEPSSPVKREYVQGRVYALAGASDRHVRLVTNVVGLLWLSARGTGCRVYASDMKLRVGPDRFYYPDVMVVCDPGDTDPYYKTRPCFLVEVLSPATEATDRREKLVAYQEIPTLRGYLLLDSEAGGRGVLLEGPRRPLVADRTELSQRGAGGLPCHRPGPAGGLRGTLDPHPKNRAAIFGDPGLPPLEGFSGTRS
jgi:Uma2 family endonuclease